MEQAILPTTDVTVVTAATGGVIDTINPILKENDLKNLYKILKSLERNGVLNGNQAEMHYAYVLKDMAMNKICNNTKQRSLTHFNNGKYHKKNSLKPRNFVVFDPAYILYDNIIYLRHVSWIVIRNGETSGAYSRSISMPNRKQCDPRLLNIYDNKLRKTYNDWTLRGTRYFVFYRDIVEPLLKNNPNAQWICRNTNVCRKLLICQGVYLGNEKLNSLSREEEEIFKANDLGKTVEIKKTNIPYIPLQENQTLNKHCWQMKDALDAEHVETKQLIYVPKNQTKV